LKKTPANYIGVINNIDHLLVKLIKGGCIDLAEQLLETLLCEHDGLKITAFDYFSNELLDTHKESLNLFVTKWLLSGKANLCRAIQDLLHEVNGEDVELCVHRVGSVPGTQKIFLARKVVGWLFSSPVGAASFILSLVGELSPEEINELEELLFDPLLLSYTGELRKYFEGLEQKSESDIKQLISRLLLRLDVYFEEMKEAFDTRELRAPQENAEHYWNSLNRKMQQAREEGPKGLFEDICTVQHLLYGNSTIAYVYDGAGQAHRSEANMHTISHSTEIPRLYVIDPEGLDYMLRTYRLEGFKDETNS